MAESRQIETRRGWLDYFRGDGIIQPSEPRTPEVDESDILEMSDSDDDNEDETSLDLSEHRAERNVNEDDDYYDDDDEEEEEEEEDDESEDEKTLIAKRGVDDIENDNVNPQLSPMQRLEELEDRVKSMEEILDLMGEMYFKRRNRYSD